MGRRNSSCRGPLPSPDIRPDDPTLTRFAGAIPLLDFMVQDLRLISRLRDVVRFRGRRRKYPVHVVLYAFVAGALLGVRRMAHLEWLRDDAVLLKWLRLPAWPVRKVFSAALQWLGEEARSRLAELVADFGFRSLRPDITSLVIDIDPTAIVDHGKGERSRFGYCGKGRRRRRHLPVVASVAETRAIIAARYRGGEQMNGEEILDFYESIIADVERRLTDSVTVFFRGDSGMWTRPVLDSLLQAGCGFTFAAAMKSRIKAALLAATWEVDEDDELIEFTSVPGSVIGHAAGLRLIGVRRRDDDPDAPALGKLLPGCHHYRYQAILTDRDWAPKDVWRFYNHRADCERVFRTGKQALGLGNLVGRRYGANAAAFLLRALAFNIDVLFQRQAEERARDEGRKVVRVGLEWRQFRFYNSPGRLLREHSRWVLRVPTNPKLAKIWEFYRPSTGTSASGVAM